MIFSPPDLFFPSSLSLPVSYFSVGFLKLPKGDAHCFQRTDTNPSLSARCQPEKTHGGVEWWSGQWKMLSNKKH
jgi:hypothetical protein